MEIFGEISIVILLVTGVSLVMKLLKLPFVVGYILTGILVGPYAFNLLQSKENIEFLSKIGIIILLFIVGLGLNPKVLREVGKISLLAGLSQVVFTAFFGYLICRLLGIPSLEAVYIAIALAFSSTIIIHKLLTDKGDLDSLYGKISIGILLVQDLVATIILILVPTIATAHGDLASVLGLLVLKSVALSVILVLLSKLILPKILEYIAGTQELLFLFSIAWVMILATVFHGLGFSIEIGALAAGVVLSTSPFAAEIGSRMKPLRDFFILLFFILLGSQITLDTFPQLLLPTIILSLFVIVGKPIVVIILMNLLGYKRKTGFMVGLTVAQISEFSLILVGLGAFVGHISDSVLPLVTLVGLFTIGGSSYTFLHADFIYKRLEKLIKLLELRTVSREKAFSPHEPAEIILFGYDRAGADFVKAIEKLKKSYVIADYNPEAIGRLKKQGLPYAYGDADDIEFLEELGIDKAKLIISTIPSLETNKLLIERLHRVSPKAISLVLSENITDTFELYKLGASYVFMPVYLGAQYAAHMVGKHGLDSKSFSEERERHIKHLSKAQVPATLM